MVRPTTDFGVPKIQIPPNLYSKYGTVEVHTGGKLWKVVIPGFHIHPDVAPSEVNKLSYKEFPFSSEGETLEEALNALSKLEAIHSIQRGGACGRNCPHYFEF